MDKREEEGRKERGTEVKIILNYKQSKIYSTERKKKNICSRKEAISPLSHNKHTRKVQRERHKNR